MITSKDYFCSKCGAEFDTRRELDVHFRIHREQSEDEKAKIGGVIKYIESQAAECLLS